MSGHSSGVYRIDCTTLDRPNAYVVDDGEVTLVDSGWPGDEETLRTGLDAIGIGPADVDRVLVTHHDADHVGGLARLTPELDAPVYVHELDAPYVAGEKLPPWTGRLGVEVLHRLFYRRMDLPELPVRTVEDGELVGGFRAYHTPGHTPGHVSYVHEDLGAAFLGDLAIEYGGKLRAADRISSYDAQEAKASIRTLLDEADFEYACPGHGSPTEEGREELARTVE